MVSLGLTSTELGSIGYLPTDPVELRTLLDRFGMHLTGGFNALVLHDVSRSEEMLARATESADLLAAAGAVNFVTCAVSDLNDWHRPTLSESEWATLFTQLEQVDRICSDRGLVQAFHPHVDSLVETAEEIERVLVSTTVGFVLETGHMLIGGMDPLSFAIDHVDRVVLVHLKDVRVNLIEPLNRDELTLMQAVQEGIFPSLGDGGAPIAEVVHALEGAGYRGRYVIEQDAALTDGLPANGEGPVRDVQSSVAYLQSIVPSIDATLETHNKGEIPV
jgi:inosose dehydratase